MQWPVFYSVCRSLKASSLSLSLRHRAIHMAAVTVKGPFNFVNGQREDPVDAEQEIKVTQPATGTLLCTFSVSGQKEVDRAVKVSKAAFPKWSRLSGRERGQYLLAAARRVRERLDDIVHLEVLDTGKPIWEARVDIAGCADVLEYYGGLAAAISGSHHQLPGGSFATVNREPLGVVAGIGAWNYPFQVIVWKAAPALACGNTFIYKPSEMTPVTSVILAEILSEVGVPDGVINVVQGDASTGSALCLHSDVAKISFTGSVNTGKTIMKLCSSSMKRLTLELGGKSPLIVFADSDVKEAVKATMLGNFLTQGQVCTNCTRVFVERGLLKEFQDHLVAACKAMVVGDPFNENTTVGATISSAHAMKIRSYIEGAQPCCLD